MTEVWTGPRACSTSSFQRTLESKPNSAPSAEGLELPTNARS